MSIIKKEDYVFDVDVEKTKEYYSSKTLCDCDECRNFYRQAENTFPKIKDFLLDFGIDIVRPKKVVQHTIKAKSTITLFHTLRLVSVFNVDNMNLI